MITWIHIELVFGYLWWMGLGSRWFHQHLEKRTHPLDVGEPKTELKLQGWCEKVNSFSYVSNPNMQCLEAEWNHFVSCFDLHSHVPIKLFYVCQIFVWLCSLSLVGSICDPLMFVTCMEHNKTYEKWIPSHVHHVRMTHRLMYGPYDKSWFQPHWTMCINVWLKMTQYSFNRLSVGWIFPIVH
jgi:hypothetical protein